MKEIKRINRESELESLIKNSENELIVVFKNSTRCPISFGALREFELWAAELNHPNIQLYRIDVIEQRNLSNYLVELTGVQHQSPQIIFIINGNVVDHYSHSTIRKERLNESISEIGVKNEI